MKGVWKFLSNVSNSQGISEIVINGPQRVFVEKEGQFIQLQQSFTPKDIYDFIQDVSDYNQRPCDAQNPILDGTIGDGSRVNIIMPPFSKSGPAISIRRYEVKNTSFEENPHLFGLGEKWVQFMRSLVLAKCNIVVSGGTSSGKTTFLNLLLQEVSKTDRLVSIEDTIELQINGDNVVRLEASGRESSRTELTYRDLVKNTLRMRPDRIIVGESRGGEFFDLLMAMNTGHEGSMTTIHANSPKDCLIRMQNLFLLSGFEVPGQAIKYQISTAIDYIIQLSKTRSSDRIVESILEVSSFDGNNILTSEIATAKSGVLEFSGVTPKKMQSLQEKGGLEKSFFQDL